MTTAVAVAIRASAGNVVQEMVGGHGNNSIQVHAGDSISLNISPGSVLSYIRLGNDLLIQLADGQYIRFVDWFGHDGVPQGQLYLSSDGMMSEIRFTGENHGVLTAENCLAPYSEDWQALNGLRFDCRDPLVGVAVSGHGAMVGSAVSPALLGVGVAVVGGAVMLSGKGGTAEASPDLYSRTIDGGGTSTTVTLDTADSGIRLSGSGVPGEMVTVAIGSSTQATTVGADGRWTVQFPASGLPEDGTYIASATFLGDGNPTTVIGGSFTIDLNAPPITVTEGFESTGSILNILQYSAGVTLSGTTEPGAALNVTLGVPGQPGAVARAALVNPDGTWSVTFTSAEVAGGERRQVVTITSTDRYGQSSTRTEAILLDTIPPPLDLNHVAGDNLINRSEAGSVIVISGTATPGSEIRLQIEGVQGSTRVTANALGEWTHSLLPGTFPEGVYSRQVTVSTTDLAGNETIVTRRLGIDTIAPSFASSDFRAETGADAVLNAQEREAGLPISGWAEAGVTVVVTMNGHNRTAIAGADGRWSVTFSADQIPKGEIASVPFSVIARDEAGNTSGPFTSSFALDTIAPNVPVLLETQDGSGGMRGISTTNTGDIYNLYRIDASGGAVRLSATVTQDSIYDETVYRFLPGQLVPDGSYLIIANQDTAGNAANTLVINSKTTGATVDLGREGLRDFDISTIDLTRAPDARLTISAQQLEDLVGPDKRLFINGESSDHVTLQHVTHVQENVLVNGQLYDIYTLGSSGAQVLLEDDLSRMVLS